MSSMISNNKSTNFNLFNKLFTFGKKDSLRNRQEDIVEIMLNKSTPLYLGYIREKYQIKLNEIKKNYQIKLENTDQNNIDNIKIEASNKEYEVYIDYIKEVKLYLYGEENKKRLNDYSKDSIEDQIVLCIDTSWSMFSLFDFSKKNTSIYNIIRDIYSLVNILDMKKTKIAIIGFNEKLNIVSDFSSSKNLIFLKLLSLMPSLGYLAVYSWIFKFDRFNKDNIKLALNHSAKILLNNKINNAKQSIIYFSDLKFDGVDNASSDYAKSQKEKLFQKNENDFIEAINDFSKLNIRVYTYENDDKYSLELSNKVNLKTEDLLEKYFNNIHFDNLIKNEEKKQFKKLKDRRNQKMRLNIPELTMYFTHNKAMENV